MKGSVTYWNMFDKLKKQYLVMVQIDSTKEATMVGSMEGYSNVRIDNMTEDLYRNNKVQLTIPTPRRYFSAVKRCMKYSDMGILSCIIKQA